MDPAVPPSSAWVRLQHPQSSEAGAGVCSTRLNAGVSLLMQKQDPPPCIISSLVLTKPEKETQGEDSEP